MPIPIPNLDDRSFQDLVDELVARIPAHTPEWTNPAPGDPGRTLIELFAWLADTLLYRVNLIPERQRLAFLRLLGVKLRAASAARTLVAISFAKPELTSPQRLAPRTAVKGPVPFETQDELIVLPIVGELYRKRPLAPAEQQTMAAKVAALKRLYPTDGDVVPYMTTAVCAEGRPETGGLDLISGTVDQALWFALLTPPVKSPDLTLWRAALSPSGTSAPPILNVGWSPALHLPTFGEGATPRPPVPHVWEVCVRTATGATGYRVVKRRELEIVVSRVEGVDGVYGPNLFIPTSTGGWQKVVAADGNESAEIPLLAWQLPELMAVGPE